jgi:hypothetical protein
VCLYIKYSNLLYGLHAVADIHRFFEDVISVETIERDVKVAVNGDRGRIWGKK